MASTTEVFQRAILIGQAKNLAARLEIQVQQRAATMEELDLHSLVTMLTNVSLFVSMTPEQPREQTPQAVDNPSFG